MQQQNDINTNKCSICGSDNKIILDEYEIRTRIPGKEKVNIKGVHFIQCSVCGNKELTNVSEEMIKAVREHYKKQYMNQPQDEIIENQEVGFLGKLKRFVF